MGYLKQILYVSIFSKIIGISILSFGLYFFKQSIIEYFIIFIVVSLWYFYFPTYIKINEDGLFIGFLFGHKLFFKWQEIKEIKKNNYFTHDRLIFKIRYWIFAIESYDIKNFESFYEQLIYLKENFTANE